MIDQLCVLALELTEYAELKGPKGFHKSVNIWGAVFLYIYVQLDYSETVTG